MPYLPLVEALRSCSQQCPEDFEELDDAEAEIIFRILGKTSGEIAATCVARTSPASSFSYPLP